jgi:hypothetical protein
LQLALAAELGEAARLNRVLGLGAVARLDGNRTPASGVGPGRAVSTGEIGNRLKKRWWRLTPRVPLARW